MVAKRDDKKTQPLTFAVILLLQDRHQKTPEINLFS